MNPNKKLKSFILAGACALGLALTVSAQTTDATVASTPTDDTSLGLLGSNYSSLKYRYSDVKSADPGVFRGVGVELNQAWRSGVDFNLNYDWARASSGSVRLTSQDLNFGATLFSKLDWGKPYLQALAGWEWRRGGGASDDSFAYTIGTGAELQVSRLFVVTPYINFVRATGFPRSEVDFGVKGTYRITRQWGLSAGVELDAVRHAKDAMTYTAGVNYHF